MKHRLLSLLMLLSVPLGSHAADLGALSEKIANARDGGEGALTSAFDGASAGKSRAKSSPVRVPALTLKDLAPAPRVPALAVPPLPQETPAAAAKKGERVHYVVELFTGSAYNLPMPLTIRQEGQPDLHQTADYYTSPFAVHAPYYAWRVGRWEGKAGWEIEHIHTKLFLANMPPEVTTFQITHGYNYLLLNRAGEALGLIFRVGVGAIITHPETTVRGKSWDEESGGTLGGGYYVSGIGAQGAVEKRLYVSDHAFAAFEGKVTGGIANIPVMNGNADVPAVSVHGLFGFGADF